MDHASYRKAPSNTTFVEFAIAIGTLTDSTGVILHVSLNDYSVADTPSVTASISSFSFCLMKFGKSLVVSLLLLYITGCVTFTDEVRMSVTFTIAGSYF